MDRQESFLDRLFLRFSYSSKLKFALFLCYLPCLVIIAIALLLYLRPSLAVDKQKMGAQFYRDLNGFTESVLKNEYDLDATFARLAKDQQLLETYVDSQFSEDFEDIAVQLNRMRILWITLKKAHAIGSEEVLEEIQELIDAHNKLALAISRVSGLVLNVDYATRDYVNALVKGIPQAQHAGALLMQSTKEPIVQGTLVKLASSKDQLEAHDIPIFDAVKDAQRENPTFQEEPASLKTNEQLETYRTANEEVLQQLNKILVNPEDVSQKMLFEASQSLISASFKLADTMTVQLINVLDRQKQTLRQDLLWSLIPLLLGIVLSLGLYGTQFIRRPLNNITQAARKFAKGDLSIRIPLVSSDEVGGVTQAFNHMMAYAEKLLSNSATIAQHLTQSTSNITDAAKQLESNLHKQEKTIKSINVHARGILRVMQDFGENIQKISQSATMTEGLASAGRTSMHEMGLIMQQMILASSNIVKTLSSLQEKVSTINQVIESIVKIADQSNLLSLNTAIRASKAGGQGRGFVVIANKIREMANQIAYATLDIEHLIQEIVESVLQAVQEVDHFSENIRKQVEDTQEVNEELNRLIGDTQLQIQNFAEINAGTQNQTQEVEGIYRSIGQLREGAQETTHVVRKLYGEIESLHTSSSRLHKLIDNLNLSQ